MFLPSSAFILALNACIYKLLTTSPPPHSTISELRATRSCGVEPLAGGVGGRVVAGDEEGEEEERERECRAEVSVLFFSLYLSQSSHRRTTSSNVVYLLISEICILYFSSSESQNVVIYSACVTERQDESNVHTSTHAV
jgi:hypothetical protein